MALILVTLLCMKENETPIQSLFEKAENYSKTSLELFKLQAVDKSADVMSSLISRLAVIITVVLSLLIVNIGLALFIGKLIGDSFYGFFVIGGIYAIIAVILHQFRHQWIKDPISNSIINQMLKQKLYEK